MKPSVFKQLSAILTLFFAACIGGCKTKSHASASLSESVASKPYFYRNYDFSIIASSNIPSGVGPTSTFEQIQAADIDTDRRKAQLFKAMKITIFPLLEFVGRESDGVKANVQALAITAGRAFTDQIIADLKKVKQRSQFRIMIVPTAAKGLVAKAKLQRMEAEPIQANFRPRLYASDKFLLLDDLSETADSQFTNETYHAMGLVMSDYELRSPKVPYFLSLVLDIDLSPNTEESSVSIQTVIGLPTQGDSIEFKEGNEQIQFKSIAFPHVVHVGLLPSPDDYPCAFVDLHIPLARPTEGKIHINFGPLGSIVDGKMKWPTAGRMDTLVPKLRGTPAVKGKNLNFAEIDFNVFNLTLDFQGQKVEGLNLFISGGLSRFPNTKFARLNVSSIDQQFQDEINKAIQVQIAQQFETLSSKIPDGIVKDTFKIPAERFLMAIFGTPEQAASIQEEKK